MLKNLNTQSTTSHSSLTNELIGHGHPKRHILFMACYFKKTDVVETAQSATWKSCNAGGPIVSYTPFPADLLVPLFAATLTGIASQTSSWQGKWYR